MAPAASETPETMRKRMNFEIDVRVCAMKSDGNEDGGQGPDFSSKPNNDGTVAKASSSLARP